MPLIQDDPETDLNSFIDVAIKEDDNNPIVKASRTQNPLVRNTKPRQFSFNNETTAWRSTRIDSGGKSVWNEPTARQRQRNNLPRETSRKSVTASADSARGLFLTEEFQSIELGTEEEDDAISLGSHGTALFRPDKDFLINTGDGSSGRVHHGEGSSINLKNQRLGIAQANLKAEREAERVSMLEQQMARVNFEFAEAKAAVDWHKLEQRHLQAEFEDLQAFCKQLQEDNAMLKDGIVPTRKKKGAWFKPERIRELNQPRQRMDYQQQEETTPTPSQTTQRLMDESLRSRLHHPSDGDWDDDTLTTSYGGTETASHEKHNAMGSLHSSMDRRGSRRKRLVDSLGQPISGSLHTDDTPKAITVTNQEVSTEQTIQKMVEMLEEDCNDFHDSTKDTTAQTELADYRNHIEEDMDDQVFDDVDEDNEIAPNDEVPEGEKGGRRNGFFSRFNQKTPNKSPKMKRNDEDGEQSVDTMRTEQTTKTMPALGWNLKGRRASFIEKHRFEPARRSSATENNLSMRGSYHSSNYADMDDLDLHTSTHERKRAEPEIEEDTTAKLKDDLHSCNKPWWAKMQKNIPKLNKPFQISQQKQQWQVDNKNDLNVPSLLEDESEVSEAWDQVGQELLPFERRSRSEYGNSDEEMPCDLSGPAVPSSLHDYLPNYFDESNGRLDAAAYFDESQGRLDATAYFEDNSGRALDAGPLRFLEVNSK